MKVRIEFESPRGRLAFRRGVALAAAAAVSVPVLLYAALPVPAGALITFHPGQTIKASDVNANFSTLANAINNTCGDLSTLSTPAPTLVAAINGVNATISGVSASSLTQTAADARYLKLTGGTVSGGVTFLGPVSVTNSAPAADSLFCQGGDGSGANPGGQGLVAVGGDGHMVGQTGGNAIEATAGAAGPGGGQDGLAGLFTGDVSVGTKNASGALGVFTSVLTVHANATAGGSPNAVVVGTSTHNQDVGVFGTVFSNALSTGAGGLNTTGPVSVSGLQTTSSASGPTGLAVTVAATPTTGAAGFTGIDVTGGTGVGAFNGGAAIVARGGTGGAGGTFGDAADFLGNVLFNGNITLNSFATQVTLPNTGQLTLGDASSTVIIPGTLDVSGTGNLSVTGNGSVLGALTVGSLNTSGNVTLGSIASTIDIGGGATTTTFHGASINFSSITKSGGSFKIDHPVEPENKFLYHSFVESPDMKNVYDGVVVLDAKGEATVELPSYFEALNKDFRYQLTCIGGFAPVYVSQEIHANRFSIAGGKPGLKVSWQVTGIRQDAWANAHRIQPEVEKSPTEKGKFLSPVEYGRPESDGIYSQQTHEARANASKAPAAPAAAKHD
jgi:hypothetical protein